MKHTQLDFGQGFQVVLGNQQAQAAEMVLAAGESTGGPDNRHSNSDQWLFVVSGQGKAIVDNEPVELSTGALLVIEHGEAHEIRNTGEEPLRTLNFYVPPVYG